MTGSFQLMKSLNLSLILNTIREKGPISRADVAKVTKLTPPTVSNLVRELLETEMVIESNLGVSKGGRKPTMLVINAKNFFIIGLDVGPKHVKAVLADLNANILQRYKVKIPFPATNEKLLELLKEVIYNMKKNLDESKLLGIGVAMHGMVDVKNGLSLFAPNLQLRDIPIKEYLENEFNILVKVENDARAMALGEYWFGIGKEIDHMVAVNVGSGIGAGIVIDGKLLYGENDISGEIGHMTIDIDGLKCSCGNYGCLQTLASGPALAERAIKELAIGKESLLTELTENNLEKIDGALIYNAALKGDQLSIDILHETARYLGIGLTNLIHTVNPKRIVIGGGVSKANQFILKTVKRTIETRALTKSAKQTEVMISELGDDATSIGAVALIFTQVFAS
ncbi:ROK family transcriptional regulator [Bacillus taeanensis]|uniref:ROK family transcriptional regulator n=2 Tax=Bacillus taeanensis TaxID=273032 RepID=A0A366XSP5_9BACI|nr:ROK family transcriptional regulator [Bacillus taeanensis]